MNVARSERSGVNWTRFSKTAAVSRRTPTAVLPTAYAKGREEALEETGLYRLPRACPWTIEQVMSPEFLPD